MSCGEADWDPGGPAQTDRSFTGCTVHTSLASYWLTSSNREICQALRENKEVQEQKCVPVCVCLWICDECWLSDELQKEEQTWCNNPFFGTPMTALHPVPPPNQPPARCMSCGLIVMWGGKIMGAGGLCTSTKVPICIPPPPSRNATLLHFSFKLQLIPGAVQRGSRCYRLLRPTPRRHNPPTPLSACAHTYVCSFSRLALQRTQKKIVESSREKTQE